MKKKEIEENVEVSMADPYQVDYPVDKCSKILPITEVFGNGDLNTLRDKINEIIEAIQR